MKIVHYAYDDVNNPYCGGGGAFRELMIHRMLASQHEIGFYTGNFSGARNSVENGITFSHIGLKRNYLLSRVSFSFLATIHSLFVKADLIVIAYSVFAPVMTFLFRKKRTVLEFYHLTNAEPFKKYSIFGVFPWIAERTALIFCQNFVTLTDSMTNFIHHKYPAKTVATTYTGFEERIFQEKQKPIIDKKYILYFGRIDIHMKGIDVLVDGFEKIAPVFPEYLLVIAGRGSGSDVNRLEKRITTSTAKNQIILKLNATKPEKFSLFQNAAFVCMPSRFEGWCISAIEAAACGKATIGTDIMGLRDSIMKDKTGILVPSENSDALSGAMKLLFMDEQLRNELGKNGIEWAKNFSWERVAGLQEEFYKKVKKRNFFQNSHT